MSSYSLYEMIGGRVVLDKVHKIFYDKIYKDPWLKQFFDGIDQDFIEKQQSDFMSSIMGGPKVFSGVMPKMAHMRMFISQELMDLRTDLLKKSMLECQVPVSHINLWLKKDASQHFGIIKKMVSEAKPRYVDEKLLVISKPR